MAHIASGSTRGNDGNAGSPANAFEQRVAANPNQDKTAGSNSGSAANTFELRVVAQNLCPASASRATDEVKD